MKKLRENHFALPPSKVSACFLYFFSLFFSLLELSTLFLSHSCSRCRVYKIRAALSCLAFSLFALKQQFQLQRLSLTLALVSVL